MSDKPKQLENGNEFANSLFAMVPTGKHDFKTGQPEMAVMIQQGMTLRDHFAASAMNGFLQGVINDDYSFDSLARDCYRAADALVAARSGGSNYEESKSRNS